MGLHFVNLCNQAKNETVIQYQMLLPFAFDHGHLLTITIRGYNFQLRQWMHFQCERKQKHYQRSKETNKRLKKGINYELAGKETNKLRISRERSILVTFFIWGFEYTTFSVNNTASSISLTLCDKCVNRWKNSIFGHISRSVSLSPNKVTNYDLATIWWSVEASTECVR